ncbi:hypothetical protein [Methanosarcina acetivorans]|nr:hypothetical protein [Methanosarcina acetivorans]
MDKIEAYKQSIEKTSALIYELQALRRIYTELLLNEAMESMIRWMHKTNQAITAIIKDIDFSKREVTIRTNSEWFLEGRMKFSEFLELYKM